MHTNVQMTARLASALDQIMALCNQEADTFSRCSEAAPALLASLEEAKAAFAEATRALPSAQTQKARVSERAAEPTCVIDATPTTASVMSAKEGAEAVEYGANVAAGKHIKPTKQE